MGLPEKGQKQVPAPASPMTIRKGGDEHSFKHPVYEQAKTHNICPDHGAKDGCICGKGAKMDPNKASHSK